MRLLLLESPAPVVMPLLDCCNVWEVRFDSFGDIAFNKQAIKAPLVRVERESRLGHKRLRRIPPECHYDSIGKNGQGSEGESHVIQMLPMILADDELELDMAAGPDREIDDSCPSIELVRLILCFHH